MIIDKKNFCIYIEDQYVTNKKTMIDTVLDACAEFNVDPSMANNLINRSVREKLKKEFISLNYLKAESTVIV